MQWFLQHPLLPKFLMLVRYGIAGALGGVVQTVTLYVWVSVLSLESSYLWGVVLGFVLAVVVSFVLQRYWTFRSVPQQKFEHQFLLYLAIAIGMLGLNLLLLALGKQVLESLALDFFHVWYLVLQVGVLVVISLTSFLINYFITFRAHKHLTDGAG